MKLILNFVLCNLTLFSLGQTWQSTYDSCLKYQDLQKFKLSLEWGDKALELYEKQVSVKDTNYSNILNRQFENCYYSGQYKKGEWYAKKDSIWARSTNNLERYALSCNNLALLYKQQGKYSEAEPLFKEDLAISTKLLGKEHYDYTVCCNNLAGLYYIQGKYSEAEPLYKEALSIRAKLLGRQHPNYATSCNNIAVLYEKQGRYTEAESLYKEALEIYAKKLGKESLDYAQSCNNLAAFYKVQGKYTKAELFYKESKEVYTKIVGKEHPEYATCCTNLGLLYQTQDKYSQAELLYNEAMAIRIRILGKEHADYAVSCNNLALLYQKQGKYNEAESLYKEALAIRAKVLGKDHPDYAQACNNLAGLYQKQGKYNEAEPLHKEAIRIKFREIEENFKNLSETEKETYIKANTEHYFNDFQNFVQKRYTQNPAVTEDSYNLTIATKGLILQSTEKIKNRIWNSKDENLKNLYMEWKQTKDKYAKALNLTIKQRQQKGINLEELAQKVNELEKQLALKSEDFAHTFTPKPVTWKDIQNAMKKDQAAIEMVRINAKEDKTNGKDSIIYIALIIKKSSQYPEIVVFNHGNLLEKEYFTNYKRSIRHKINDPYSYNAFWKPIADQLKGIKTVYFSPEGLYNQININTLQNPETKKYVFDEIQIINLTNTKDILEQKKAVSKNSYLIGNPKFNLGIDTKNNEKSEEQRSIGNLSQLEGAEKEVKEASSFFPNAVTIIGKDATEEYVKSLKNPRVLHIATHGYFKKGQYQSSTQAMLNAGLLFAGVVDYDRMDIRPYDKDDGKLTAFEVMNMELDSTELVVISACETGLGKASKEGVYGLQRAFKVAGAQTIIMSLWKISDRATQLLMTKFYENWQKKGMNKRKAFETAQQDLRKKYKEPYYWGAFVMIE